MSLANSLTNNRARQHVRKDFSEPDVLSSVSVTFGMDLWCDLSKDVYSDSSKLSNVSSRTATGKLVAIILTELHLVQSFGKS